MPITVNLVPPSLDDIPNFEDDAEQFCDDLVQWTDEANALETNVNAKEASATAAAAAAAASEVQADAAANASVNGLTLFATSATNLSPTAGAKALAWAEVGCTFADGDDVYLIRRGAPGTRMHGPASLVNNIAKTMTVTVPADGFAGAGGPYSDWLMIHGALVSLIAGSATDLLTGTSAIAALTAKALNDAAAFAALVDAPTVAWNVRDGFNASLVMNPGVGTTRAIGAPTNLVDGQIYTLDLVQPALGGPCTATWNAMWDFGQLGTPSLSTTANAVDKVFAQYRSSTNKLYASFRRAA